MSDTETRVLGMAVQGQHCSIRRLFTTTGLLLWTELEHDDVTDRHYMLADSLPTGDDVNQVNLDFHTCCQCSEP
jgi:hypothetical protein